jgi:hypothetical protein
VKLRVISLFINFRTAQSFGPANAIQQRFVAFSRLPVDSVLFEIGVHRAAYRRIEVGGTEAIE